ncbi:MAG: hypothetical protein WC738_00640 [Candidatus Omnitrophota bacterium]
MKNKKGFILVITTAFIASLLVVALAIIGMSCGEIIQTRVYNDQSTAYYVARSGAEMMYNYLKAKEGETITWPQSMPSGDSVVRTRGSGGTIVGNFVATADTISSNMFGIVSTGSVNGRTAKVTVKYGCDAAFENGRPIGCAGAMSLKGAGWWIFKSYVRAEGPLASGSAITSNNFVQISGTTLQNQTFEPTNFWWKYNSATGTCSTPKAVGDTNGDNAYLTDANGDGSITLADAGENIAAQEAFINDDINSDGVVNNKDAFISYYTVELNHQGLNIGKNETRYYGSSQSFNYNSIPTGVPIVFVNGDVNISFNSTAWWAQNSNNTIVATGDINIAQPTNTAGNTLTLISYGDVNTGGVNFFGGISGNLVVCSVGDFNAYYGGKSNGAIFSNGQVNIDTVYPISGLLNRDIKKGTTNWSDSTNWPLGLPQNYGSWPLKFAIKADSVVKPIWQRE